MVATALVVVAVACARAGVRAFGPGAEPVWCEAGTTAKPRCGDADRELAAEPGAAEPSRPENGEADGRDMLKLERNERDGRRALVPKWVSVRTTSETTKICNDEKLTLCLAQSSELSRVVRIDTGTLLESLLLVLHLQPLVSGLLLAPFSLFSPIACLPLMPVTQVEVAGSPGRASVKGRQELLHAALTWLGMRESKRLRVGVAAIKVRCLELGLRA